MCVFDINVGHGDKLVARYYTSFIPGHFHLTSLCTVYKTETEELAYVSDVSEGDVKDLGCMVYSGAATFQWNLKQHAFLDICILHGLHNAQKYNSWAVGKLSLPLVWLFPINLSTAEVSSYHSYSSIASLCDC